MWNLQRQRDIIESLVFRSFVDFQNVLLAPGDFVLKETKLWKSSWHCTMIQSANYSNRFHRNLPSSAVIWSSILCHRNSNSVVWESYGLITSIALPQPQFANNLPGFRHSCHHRDAGITVRSVFKLLSLINWFVWKVYHVQKREVSLRIGRFREVVSFSDLKPIFSSYDERMRNSFLEVVHLIWCTNWNP